MQLRWFNNGLHRWKVNVLYGIRSTDNVVLFSFAYVVARK